jgi:hypothetical protein
MMIATMHDALPLFGFAGLILGGAAFVVAAAVWVLRAAAPRQRLPRAGRFAVAAALAVVSVPGWVYGGFFALIGWATVGCSPDAYECPF